MLCSRPTGLEMATALPAERRGEVLFLAVSLTLNMSAGYHRRVVNYLDKFLLQFQTRAMLFSCFAV